MKHWSFCDKQKIQPSHSEGFLGRWGHGIAEGAFGKGHGSRAFLHALRNSFVMHDASYMCPVELQGSADAVSTVLQEMRWVLLLFFSSFVLVSVKM